MNLNSTSIDSKPYGPAADYQVSDPSDNEFIKGSSEKKEQYIAFRALAYVTSSIGLIFGGGNMVITAFSMVGSPMWATLIPGALMCAIGICSISGILEAIKTDPKTHEEFHLVWSTKTQSDLIEFLGMVTKALLGVVSLTIVGVFTAALAKQPPTQFT